MSCVYVFAATEMEARPLRNIAASDELVLITGAMGPRNARSKAESVLSDSSRKPDVVLVVGLCGALTPSLPEGRIVTYTECVTTEGGKSSLQCSRNIVESVGLKLKSAGITCDPVVGITSARIATTRDERLGLAKSGAAVVDMESYSIVQTAANAGVPAGVVRVVADAIDRTLPDFNVALNETGGLDGRKALQVALTSPFTTAKLLAANRRAMQRLVEALQIILKNGCFARATAV